MFMGYGFLSPWGVPHARRFAGLAMRPAPQALPQVGVHARIEAVFEAGSMGLDGPTGAVIGRCMGQNPDQRRWGNNSEMVRLSESN